MARERLEPDVGLDFGLLVSRLTTAFAMLASSFGPPRSSRPAPPDSDAWSKVDVELNFYFDDLIPEGTEAERKYSHVLVVQETADACEPRVGLPDHESVYDFVGRVVFENVDIKEWNMEVNLATATTDESNVRHYEWNHEHLPPGAPGVSLVHRDVGEHDEHVSEGVTFARQHVEIKEIPKRRDGKLDTWEGAALFLSFTSRHPHCNPDGAGVSNEIWDAVHSAVMGLPEGVQVRIRSPSGDDDGACIENVFQAPTRTIAPLIPKSSATVQLWDRTNREHFYAMMKSGRFVATDPRASCSVKLCLNVFPRWSLREMRLKVSCAVFTNYAAMKAEQSRGLVDSLWVKPVEMWDEHNLAPVTRTRSDERDRSTAHVDPSAAIPEDTRDALALCAHVGKRPAPSDDPAPSLDDDHVGDDVAAIIAGDAPGRRDDAGDDGYLTDFPRDAYVPHEIRVYFTEDAAFPRPRGVPDLTGEDPGFRLPSNLFHARGSHLPRQLRDRMIGVALKGALKDLKRQDRYGFIGGDERERLKVCDAVIASALNILEAAGPERAPEFFSQIQRMVDERPDLDWKKAFERKLRATAFE